MKSRYIVTCIGDSYRCTFRSGPWNEKSHAVKQALAHTNETKHFTEVWRCQFSEGIEYGASLGKGDEAK